MNAVAPTVLASSDEPPASEAAGAADAEGEPDQPPEPRHRRAGPAPVIDWLDRSGGVAGSGRPPIDHAWIRSRLAEAVAQLPHEVARLDVSVVDDAQMAALHAEHCGDPTATDVLTFVDAAPPAPIEADIAVCAGEARRRAAAGPRGVERELLLYCLHGLLHAAGYDDRDPAAFAGMHAREDEILEAIGVGPVFRGAPPGHADGCGGTPDTGPPTR